VHAAGEGHAVEMGVYARSGTKRYGAMPHLWEGCWIQEPLATLPGACGNDDMPVLESDSQGTVQVTRRPIKRFGVVGGPGWGGATRIICVSDV